MNDVPTLSEVRRLAMEDALNCSFKDGLLQDRDTFEFFRVLLPEVMFAALAAYEFSDPQGHFVGDNRLRDAAVSILERVSEHFDATGTVAGGDMNTAYFTLVPFTRALLSLGDSANEPWRRRMIDRAVELFADAASHIVRTHHYLNPRAMEAVSALGLYRLTSDPKYMDRCVECLNQLLRRQYPCGAQPYHTGAWIWGRRPAQVYQFLTANLMLYLGFELGREDAVEYVRRVADFSLVATNRRGEAFVTTFEGLHKSHSQSSAGRQWPMAKALGDKRFRGLARTTYELWVKNALDLGRAHKRAARTPGYLVALNDALHLGIKEEPESEPFVPPAGRHILPDISTVIVHEPELDICMTVLTGNSAFAEADCGNVKLYALTPELTDEPTYRNAGTDALRGEFRVPTEQIECTRRNGKTVLSGRVYTEHESQDEKDYARVHNRMLEVTMTYTGSEMVLEYETKKNTQPEPVPSRLLLLLIARPKSKSPHLQIGQKLDTHPPPADSRETFFARASLGTVRFSAPDGSAIEVVPEVSLAECITAERPPGQIAPMRKEGPKQRVKVGVKPANEGSLRVAFEGLKVLDRGRYRIRFAS